MKVIGFVGSQHKSGNTAWSVNTVLDGARAAGAETQAFYWSDLNIKPCGGCLGCGNTQGCVIKDDMQQIYVALKEADALVLGSPIYMGQMTAQAKTFTDRLYAQITPRFSPRWTGKVDGKKLILVWTQGNPDKAKFKEYIDYTTKMFNMLEFEVQEVIVVAGTRRGAASGQVGLAAGLQAAGARLAQ
jgi:multimeric flavodoxin WrbA